MYRYYGYTKVARNLYEDQTDTLQGQNTSRPITERINPISERVLRPRYLFFMDDTNRAKRVLVSDWANAHPGEPLEYVVIAYTTEQFNHGSNSDMNALHDIAKRATVDQGLRSYWIAAGCMPDGKVSVAIVPMVLIHCVIVNGLTIRGSTWRKTCIESVML
jgi:hypothetical protein